MQQTGRELAALQRVASELDPALGGRGRRLPRGGMPETGDAQEPLVVGTLPLRRTVLPRWMLVADGVSVQTWK